MRDSVVYFSRFGTSSTRTGILYIPFGVERTEVGTHECAAHPAQSFCNLFLKKSRHSVSRERFSSVNADETASAIHTNKLALFASSFCPLLPPSTHQEIAFIQRAGSFRLRTSAPRGGQHGFFRLRLPLKKIILFVAGLIARKKKSIRK